ncbi:MAG: nitrogenase molybdenum-iron protein subunit beta [Campylobacterales bacterium]
MQQVDNIVNGKDLFQKPEYQEVLKSKQQWEGMPDAKEVEKYAEWTKSWDYREKNLKREKITVNPAKACQPLGAVMVALGFEDTMPYVHGSHGCVAYFRSYFTRHFKEPTPCVSDSMTEDAAVFGGLQNMIDGLGNCYSLYNPKMIAVSTTCMAEVIGDDLMAFIGGAKEKGTIPEDFPVAYANTPSFVGSHITGYDNMMSSIITQLGKKAEGGEKTDRFNIIPGFETYIGSLREIKEMAEDFEADYIFLGDHSDQWDMAAGKYEMFKGGTKFEDAVDAVNSKATITLQKYTTARTAKTLAKKYKQETITCNPIGLKGTDEFVMTLAKLTGKDIPQKIKDERGRLVDAMQDSYPYMHGKKFALWGDPDFTIGMTKFLLEMGAEPTHVLCHNAPEGWEEEVKEILASSPDGKNAQVWAKKDLWHLRSLLFTEPVDFMIGNVYGKELYRDTGIPLIRIGFPIFDRHHLHRYSISGYKGALNLLTWITNAVLDKLDEETKDIAKTDYFFDSVR